ncbi:hypothetical protein CBR64_20475 [Cellulosimicrobium cellulans]|uniref:Uncharacterized protein n=1 Tax=Cellulosimicrobium cellulans TaxID=1710 RepID=A0A1Y0I228_CELCE|nr:hypothetical protein [Cellulosimicrobium cellulans]ARU53453.1 hypothetical protein CBR64_20475 [Cellulosimicrobium cellulans]
MSEQSAHQPNARAVFSAINSSPVWKNSDGIGRAPLWWGYVASSVALAAVGETIQYASLGGEAADRTLNLRGVAFTESRVISFTVQTEKGADEADFTVTTRALPSLVEYEVKTLMHPGPESSFVSWPGSPTARLKLRDGWECTIPLAFTDSDRAREELVALLIRLPRFLS